MHELTPTLNNCWDSKKGQFQALHNNKVLHKVLNKALHKVLSAEEITQKYSPTT